MSYAPSNADAIRDRLLAMVAAWDAAEQRLRAATAASVDLQALTVAQVLRLLFPTAADLPVRPASRVRGLPALYAAAHAVEASSAGVTRLATDPHRIAYAQVLERLHVPFAVALAIWHRTVGSEGAEHVRLLVAWIDPSLFGDASVWP